MTQLQQPATHENIRENQTKNSEETASWSLFAPTAQRNTLVSPGSVRISACENYRLRKTTTTRLLLITKVATHINLTHDMFGAMHSCAGEWTTRVMVSRSTHETRVKQPLFAAAHDFSPLADTVLTSSFANSTETERRYTTGAVCMQGKITIKTASAFFAVCV